jgi:hypothetical protein
MPFPINSTTDPVALRDDDGVRIASRRKDGCIEGLDLDLSTRSDATHCLVAFPALPNEIPTGSGPVRLWMSSQYRDERRQRLPFVLYVAGYRDGDPCSEERIRYFAGPEQTSLILDVTVPPNATQYQLVVYADRRYRGTLQLTNVRLVSGTTEFRIGNGTHVTREISLERQWRQEGHRLICSSAYGEHWAEMPSGWRLDEVHPASLAAADWILYSGVNQIAFGVSEPAPDPPEGQRRYRGATTMLSYSLGTDSTAAMNLLPDDTIRYYCRRPYRQYFTRAGAAVVLPDPTPWERRLDRVPNLTIVANTFEQLQLAAGGRHGFSHNFGYAAIGLLLADHTDAGVLAFGSVMEQVFLRSGHLFADVVALPRSSYNSLRRLLDAAGLFLALPTAGCSEVLTSRISETGRHAGLAISCPRAGPDGAPCGTCFKCFRKLRIEGHRNLPEPDASVLLTLEKYPLKSATSVVYGAQRSGYVHRALERYRDLDLTFLERYFDYAVEHMVPPDLVGHVRQQLALLGLEPMTGEDDRRVRTLGQVFWPESFSWARAGLPEPAPS